MPLIIQGLLERGVASEGWHVGVYLLVPRKYLSDMFNLSSLRYYIIGGEILDIKKVRGEFEYEELKLKEVIGEKIEFVFSPVLLGTYDYLYISERSWNLFRCYGIFPGDYILKVKLLRLKLNEETLEIYPKRDVIVT